MFNWISQRGKNAWIVMIFCSTTFMPTSIPGIYIMTYFNPLVGLLYTCGSFSIIYFMWLRYFDKKEHQQKG